MTQLISLVVPFYNEAEAIPHLRATLLPCLEAIPDTTWEIICIDDGSTDTTLLQLVALAQADGRFRVIEFSRNFGKEAALTAGISAARGTASGTLTPQSHALFIHNRSGPYISIMSIARAAVHLDSG